MCRLIKFHEDGGFNYLRVISPKLLDEMMIAGIGAEDYERGPVREFDDFYEAWTHLVLLEAQGITGWGVEGYEETYVKPWEPKPEAVRKLAVVTRDGSHV